MDFEVDYRRIGRHFRAARKQLNWKQKDVAEMIGVTTKTYSNMERGAQETSLYRVIQLCQLLKLKPGCVLNDCNDDLLALDTNLPETICEAKAQLMLLSSKCSDETAQLLNTISQLIYAAMEPKHREGNAKQPFPLCNKCTDETKSTQE